ncbi:DUF1822 family protein [Crocosphaera subtropica]|nr:DUF1822 family protein [Crocosphaera subtropica]
MEMNENQPKNSLTLRGTTEAFEYLQQLWQSGELEKLLGVSITNIRLKTISQTNKWENLSQWFQNSFGENWQPVETISAFAWRSNTSQETTSVTRAKLINLTQDFIIFCVTIQSIDFDHYNIHLQILSSDDKKALPEQLKLSLLDEAGNLIKQVSTQSQDNLIQLQLSSELGDQFITKIEVNSINFKEYFSINSLEENIVNTSSTVQLIPQTNTQLDKWFSGQFFHDWKPTKFTTEKEDDSEVSGIKQISLTPDITLTLEIRQQRIAQNKLELHLRISKINKSIYLPKKLELMILDQSNHKIPNLAAKADEDHWLQLKFTASPGDNFKIYLKLEHSNFLESFIV